MIIQAELRRKQSEYEGEACSVDKVIELPAQRFKQFSHALLADYDFIAENKNAIRHDEDARHCLLILDADGTDGFLVDPQGYNYARYSAFVPNARSLLTLDMGIDRSYLSPVEPWRNENRDEMLRVTLRVEGKPDYTLVLPADEEHGPFTRDEYMRTGNDRMQLIVQIESQNGLDHIDEILSLDGIDMVASGREDISQALGVPGQKDHPLVIEAENYILAKAFEHKKIPTLSVSSKERMQELWEKGVRCFSIGRDEDLCLKALKNQMTKMALTPEEKQEWHTWIFLG